MFGRKQKAQSAFRTMIAHATPWAAATAPPVMMVVQPATPNLEEKPSIDYVDIIETAAALAQDIIGVFADAPFVQPVATLVLKIIEVRSEIKANEERCLELIELVCGRCIWLFKFLNRVAASSHPEKVQDLKSDMEDYQGVLREMLLKLQRIGTSKRLSWFNRSQVADDFLKMERKLDDVHQRFQGSRLVSVQLDMAELTFAQRASKAHDSRSTFVPQALPPPPLLVIGRDGQMDALVSAITSQPIPRIAILGSGGMGKTTIATRLLHHPEIESTHPARYFIYCESLPTAELILTEIANAISIPAAKQDATLQSRVVHALTIHQKRTIICLDNFETPWENLEQRPLVEALLGFLSTVGSLLTILVTMRGSQLPANATIKWRRFDLEGLPEKDSASVYLAITKAVAPKISDVAAKLIRDLDGIPLAVTLFANLVLEGEQPEYIYSRWNAEGTSILETGGNDRLSKLDRSIQLSIFSPRMDDAARRLLGMLAYLPDGLRDTPETIERFRQTLPSDTSFTQALRTLKRASLVHHVLFGEDEWLRMHMPVQQYCKRHIDPPLPIVNQLIALYITLIMKYHDYNSAPSRAVIVPERNNFRSLLLLATSRTPLPEGITRAVSLYTEWCGFLGLFDPEIVQKLIDRTTKPSDLAALQLSLGSVMRLFGQLVSAERPLRQALALYVQVSDEDGQAKAQRKLGELLMLKDRYSEAESSLKLSLTLGESDKIGQAMTHRIMGDLYMRKDELHDAEKSLRQALDIYSELDRPNGQAQTHMFLGELLMRRDSLDPAEAALNQALTLHTKTDNRFGQAKTHKFMGELHIRRDRLDEAVSSLNQALKFYTDVDDQLGQANCKKALGEAKMKMDQLDEAQEDLVEALNLYTLVENTLGQALTHQMIGDLMTRKDRLEDAERSIRHAAQMFKELGRRLGEANTQKALADILERLDRLEEAEPAIVAASALHKEIEDTKGQAEDLVAHARILSRQKRYEEALERVDQGLKLAREIELTVTEGDGRRVKGWILEGQGDVDGCLVEFQQALTLHKEARTPYSQRLDLEQLIRVEDATGRPEAAELHRTELRNLSGLSVDALRQ